MDRVSERREAVARALFNFLISYDSGGCCGPSCSTQEVEATSDDLADRILSLLGVAAPLGEQGSTAAGVGELSRPADPVEAAVAWAMEAHRGDVYRGLGVRPDQPFIRHVLRVTMAVSDRAKVVAALHDVLEDTDAGLPSWLTDTEVAAVRLLTREENGHYGGYAAYIETIANADGEAGEIAREVKRADLATNLAHDPNNVLRKRHIYEAARERLRADLPPHAQPNERAGSSEVEEPSEEREVALHGSATPTTVADATTSGGDLLAAAERADWEQVRMNVDPPCFHIEIDGRFCFRAKRWTGHGEAHPFTTLADTLRRYTRPVPPAVRSITESEAIACLAEKYASVTLKEWGGGIIECSATPSKPARPASSEGRTHG